MYRDDDNRWHLDKKVPISIIVTLLIYGITGLWFVADIKRDVEVLKAGVVLQHERDARQDADAVGNVTVIRESLRDVNTKLDRLIELRADQLRNLPR